ncbi:metallophosphoesterase [Cryobacterium sp. GrIS_2_6]|uniref:metallophosphoesterase n=1 Tax=Cryobacterium sp. GrIS_2_6 TaxID=3162785 RepID=UPI002DFBC685|nr:putative phosphodiesterase/putative RNA-binding protein with TRAM domain [Cryobacterium psychrotolerans]
MSGPYALQTLSTVKRIGLVGDLHGDAHQLREVAEAMRARGLSVLVATGDFGFVDSRPMISNQAWASEILAENQLSLIFVDGNHDRLSDIYSSPVDATGYRWVASNMAHLPRGFRMRVAGGRTLGALGGANSIDHPKADPLESITPDDLVALGTERVDILIGHDAPTPLPALDQLLATTDRYWTDEGRAYAAAGREMFTRGFRQVRPELYVGGHFHTYIDEVVSFGDGADRFESRVVLLADASSGAGVSCAVLDLATLELETFDLNGDRR